MRQELQNLIQSLRNELMAFAEMSIQLDRHFQFLTHPADGVNSETSNNVQIKARSVRRALKERTLAQMAIARVLQLEADATMESIIAELPTANRSLVIALVRAVRELRTMMWLTFRRNLLSIRHATTEARHFLNHILPSHFKVIPPRLCQSLFLFR